ncbi:hypothetical protein CO026_00395 [Candidatus Kaiserbacteria bacterium CG_4_9_14_0_2_um_filter_41_32]|uniref:Uncharacterized protein n=1 Tax=Candidatus Kaiserbacteria bacterium CG_4_9_14_0_2_um_filter_41_32 TaxID=1974601 RepID=A0A2M8FFP7_9BACT|nr:MAG: hypothetical protein CO026_00395 [Candidatus Kaiserbacteria bacterium CG_4_9_14_0_2_um_filter_41_32]
MTTSTLISLAVLAKLAFYLLIITYVVFTTILYYHWQNYSMSQAATRSTYLAFFVISLPLLIIMSISVLFI